MLVITNRLGEYWYAQLSLTNDIEKEVRVELESTSQLDTDLNAKDVLYFIGSVFKFSPKFPRIPNEANLRMPKNHELLRSLQFKLIYMFY